MRMCWLIACLLICDTHEKKLLRTIEAVGLPYYKMLLSIGTCKERTLFTEQKVWGSVRASRILNIYYKSDDKAMKVSRVEIRLIINNTDCYANSETGIGSQKFSASVFLPPHGTLTFYRLDIYTCTDIVYITSDPIEINKLNKYGISKSEEEIRLDSASEE